MSRNVPAQSQRENTMPTAATHTITVRPGWSGEGFKVECSCGWSSGYEEYATKTGAQGAGDRHIATTIGL